MKNIITFSIGVFLAISMFSCSSKLARKENEQAQELITNPYGLGTSIKLEAHRGPAFNHPTFVLWIEDKEGNYLQTLFITKAVATATFIHGVNTTGKWEPSEKHYPAALPYWSHKRGIKTDDSLYMPTADQPVPDAYTGATPLKSFIINTRLDKIIDLQEICILMEINQTWDWNEYWTNYKFPNDRDYKTSCQPALVYKALINLTQKPLEIQLNPIGHSHYSGKDGSLTSDLSTITTALRILDKIMVKVE